MQKSKPQQKQKKNKNKNKNRDSKNSQQNQQSSPVKQKTQQIQQSSGTKNNILGLSGLILAIAFLIKTDKNQYNVFTQLIKQQYFLSLAKYIGISMFFLTLLTIFGRVINKTVRPASIQEQGLILRGNQLLRNTILHTIIFSGLFFQRNWNNQLFGYNKQFSLLLFIFGHITYVLGSVLNQIVGCYGLHAFGWTLMISVQSMLAVNRFIKLN